MIPSTLIAHQAMEQPQSTSRQKRRIGGGFLASFFTPVAPVSPEPPKKRVRRNSDSRLLECTLPFAALQEETAYANTLGSLASLFVPSSRRIRRVSSFGNAGVDQSRICTAPSIPVLEKNLLPKTSNLELHVPLGYPTVEEAVAYANTHFRLAAERKKSNTTVTILIDPSYDCQVDSTLVVDAAGDFAKLVVASCGCEDADNHEPECLNNSKATVTMETPFPNQPLIRIARGSLTLRNLSLQHSSPMTTTLNYGAVVIDNDESSSVCLENTVVTSSFGSQ